MDKSVLTYQKKTQKILDISGLIALWDFKEEQGEPKQANGIEKFCLNEVGETLRIDDGPLSGYSAYFNGQNYLVLQNSKIGALNIYGNKQEITVMAWIKWSGEQTGFIGGLWNEYKDGGKRQYGLFVSLPHYNGKNQVCGHISATGKPTPPFPYSFDYSASKQEVKADEWQCVAFTYNGEFIKSYLNGVYEPREPELISNTIGFEGFPEGAVHSKNPYYFPYGIGNNGSDFTVGAVLLKAGMGNFYKGLIGGLAVFDKVLSDDQIKTLSDI
ncbi:MAG: LamG-like jellyroll fold domain-containing protein [Paludibacter sp.]